jgi:hypothetical protein
MRFAMMSLALATNCSMTFHPPLSLPHFLCHRRLLAAPAAALLLDHSFLDPLVFVPSQHSSCETLQTDRAQGGSRVIVEDSSHEEDAGRFRIAGR